MKVLSNTLLLEADSIIEKAPLIEKNEQTLRKMFEVVSKNGIGIATVTKIMPLISQIKK